jgi:predicted transposase/invertase (TIGR01784 family)
MDRELKEPFSDTLNEIYLELPKFKLDFSACDTPYKRFLYILNHVEIMGEIPKHIWENDNFLKKLKSAVEVERMSLDERLAYELSLSVERDWYACMEYRYEEGVEKGKLQTATNMKKSGIDLQTIVDCTGLSMEEVENL